MDHLVNLKEVESLARGIIRILNDRYSSAVQNVADTHRVILATGHMDNSWQFRSKKSNSLRFHKTWEEPEHEVSIALKAIDDVVKEHGIGPSNMLYIEPRKLKK